MLTRTPRSRPIGRGFTLIELLVVIAIIGVLSSVILASLNKAREKARDAKRQSDIGQMQLALELYYDSNGSYPNTGYWMYSCNGSWDTLQTALAPYMPTLPKDPVNTSCGGPWNTGYYTYAYGSNGAIYDLVGQFENTNNPQRCATRNWLYHYGGEASWCNSYTYSPYLFADH
jgi:type II secretion system protein G